MPVILLLMFIGVPILEIAVFIQAGEVIGLWPTLATVVVTAIIGTALLRAQGLATLARARQSLDQGKMPVEEIYVGLCLLVAGLLLLTPGFVTDSVGFLLFLPPFRRAAGRFLMSLLARHGTTRVWVDGRATANPRRGRGRGRRDAIDVDFTDLDPPNKGDGPSA